MASTARPVRCAHPVPPSATTPTCEKPSLASCEDLARLATWRRGGLAGHRDFILLHCRADPCCDCYTCLAPCRFSVPKSACC